MWNLTLRLRRRFLFVTEDLDEQWRILAEVARPLAIELNWLLYLAGRHIADNDRTGAIFDRAAETFGLPREALTQLALLRNEDQSVQPPADLYPQVLSVLERCAHLADEVPVPA